MLATKPNQALCLLPDGAKELVYAEHQPPYIPLPVIKTPKGAVTSFWQPTANDLELLKLGVPVCLTLLTFNEPLQAIILTVGGQDLRKY